LKDALRKLPGIPSTFISPPRRFRNDPAPS
jgi:hypothetical protein